MPTLTYQGHSAFLVESGDTTLIFDPFLTGNPLAKITAEEVQADYVLLTHGHGDHVGDAVQIAKANNATIITQFEVGNYCLQNGAKNVWQMHIGGAREFPFGKVKLTPALHGSELPDGSGGGLPTGMLVTTGGKTVYHMGDTGLFSDLKFVIGAFHKIDVCLIPIGDNFTMGIDDAVIAAEWIGAGLYIPMHYNTFPPIECDPQVFVRQLEAKGMKGKVMAPGEVYEF